MAKGILYQITTNPEMTYAFDERDFFEDVYELGAEYVENSGEVQSEKDLERLEHTLNGIGFVTETDPHVPGFVVLPMDAEQVGAMRKEFFAPRLQAVKTVADELTLDDFVTRRSCITELVEILDNESGDMIYLFDDNYSRILSMDDFIRELKPDTKYWVLNKTITLG